MIAIVDYGVGNLFSLHSSLRALGFNAENVTSAQKLGHSVTPPKSFVTRVCVIR